jgi:hypothetical protein
MKYWAMPIGNMRGGNAWINHAAFVAIDAREFHLIVLALQASSLSGDFPDDSRHFSSSLWVHPLQ